MPMNARRASIEIEARRQLVHSGVLPNPHCRRKSVVLSGQNVQAWPFGQGLGPACGAMATFDGPGPGMNCILLPTAPVATMVCGTLLAISTRLCFGATAANICVLPVLLMVLPVAASICI